MGQEALISRINELPRIESILQELLEMVNRETLDFGELSKKMSMDQVLSARVLRMANSAHFGGVNGSLPLTTPLYGWGQAPSEPSSPPQYSQPPFLNLKPSILKITGRILLKSR